MFPITGANCETQMTQSPSSLSASLGDSHHHFLGQSEHWHFVSLVSAETRGSFWAPDLFCIQVGNWGPIRVQWQWIWDRFHPHHQQPGGWRCRNLLLSAVWWYTPHSVTRQNINHSETQMCEAGLPQLLLEPSSAESVSQIHPHFECDWKVW